MSTYKQFLAQSADALGMMIRNAGFTMFEVNGKKYAGTIFEVKKPLSLLTKNTIDEYNKIIKECIENGMYYRKDCMKEPGYSVQKMTTEECIENLRGKIYKLEEEVDRIKCKSGTWNVTLK